MDGLQCEDFAAIPLLRIGAHIFASILTRMPKRQIKPSDTTDIDVLSSYAPYMDVFCTDAFMADQLRGFADEYRRRNGAMSLFNSSISSAPRCGRWV
jgi:hypothetical protein